MTFLFSDPGGRIVAALSCVLALTITLGLLARRCGLPPVVGEMFGGLILGPSLLSVAVPQRDALFGSLTQSQLSAFGLLGVVCYVLLIGAQTDHAVLRRDRRPVAATAVAGFLVPLTLGAGLGLVLVRSGFGAGSYATPAALVLFVGVCLSVTAVPVLGRIVEERGLAGTRVADIALSAATANDAMAWAVLGVALMLAPHGSVTQAAAQGCGAVLFVVLLLSAGRRVLRRVLGGGGYERPWGPVLVLVGCLVTAWLTSVLGLHAAFGAILFGMVLPRREGVVPSRVLATPRAIAAVLLPVFFVSAGLAADVRGLGAAGAGVLAATVVLATTGKTFGCRLAAGWGGLDRPQARTVGLLMNARGVTELVAVNIGYGAGLIDDEMYTILILMALITTVATGLLVRRWTPVPVSPAPAGTAVVVSREPVASWPAA
jgi:Kef-type K+ transport system membrane component KefB